MKFLRSKCPQRLPPVMAMAVLAAFLAFPSTGHAVLSESGGTGVFEVQSAESVRPGRLELGIRTSFQRFGFGDAEDTRLNALRGGVNAAFGIPGGFELSGALPVYGYYTSTGSGGGPIDENITARLGDVHARMRWTHGFLVPGMRWGLEGEVGFSTGDDREELYPGRGMIQPYTDGRNTYTGRAMATWDGLRAGAGIPMRLHANAAYTIRKDEGRFVMPHTPLPLDLPTPTADEKNDFMTLSAAVEVDLPRFTLFGEVVTDQLVNDRRLLEARENRIVLSPGVRFWLPGGVSLAGVYSANLSDDDSDTPFDPESAFPDHEWRLALSLGTVYRGARARAEDARVQVTTGAAASPSQPLPAAAAPSPMSARTPETTPAPVVTATQKPDTSAAMAEKRERQAEIIARRPVQEEPTKPETKTEMTVTPEPQAKPAAPESPVMPAPTVVVPGVRPAPEAGTPSGFEDADRDGIPDGRDLCPLMPEDWDGFQDLDGCPDLDNDQDGIPDIRDRCPNDPETYNNYYDFDGCPDSPQEQGAAFVPRTPAPQRSGAPDSVQLGAAETDATPAAPQRAAPAIARAAEEGQPAAMRAPADTGAAPRDAGIPAPRMAAGPGMATAETDSLRLALEFERKWSAELEARLARTDAERSAYLTRLLAPQRQRGDSLATAGPAPSAQISATQATQESLITQVERQRMRNQELATRLAEVERWQNQAPGTSAGASDRATTPTTSAPVGTPAPGTMVITPARGPESTVITPSRAHDPEIAARIAALEGEIRSLRERTASTGQQAPGTPASAVAGDTVRAEMLDRIALLQSQIDSLRTEAPKATEPAVAPEALDALDVLLPPGRSRVFPDITFTSGSAVLTAGAEIAIAPIAAAIVRVPHARVKVIGHTDNVGNAASNLRLSRERSRAVAERMYEDGVGRDQITIEGRGEESPIASNATAAGRSTNRRVEFIRTR